MCVLFSVRRLLLVASLSSVAITGFEDLKLWSPPQADDSWKVPIRVHVAKGVGCVNITGKPACETEQLFAKDWIKVPAVNCSEDMGNCELIVTIDFDFNPSVQTEKSHPKYSQQFHVLNIVYDARFTLSNDQYCLHAESDPSSKECFDPTNIYRGEDTINPYVGFQGTKPPYQESFGLPVGDANPDENASLFQTSNINGIELASKAEVRPPSEATKGLTASVTNGASLTSNAENQPQDNPDGVLRTSDFGLQTLNLNVELVPDKTYGIVSNDELVAPASLNSGLPPPGSLPLLWNA